MLCACPGAGVCLWEPGELVKTFTSWQVLASWQVLGGGVGGSSFPRITAVSGALYSVENNGTSAGQRPGLCRYPGRRITHQHLTTHIKDVIISVTMITKKLLVTRRAKMPL